MKLQEAQLVGCLHWERVKEHSSIGRSNYWAESKEQKCQSPITRHMATGKRPQTKLGIRIVLLRTLSLSQTNFFLSQTNLEGAHKVSMARLPKMQASSSQQSEGTR